MRIDWRSYALVFLAFVLTGCNGSFLSRTAPASDWLQSSAEGRQPPLATEPFGQIKSFTDLHDFGASGDGLDPYGGVAADIKGNLYGTTVGGGAYQYGSVWEMKEKSCRCGYTESVQYSFKANKDGSEPFGGLTQDPVKSTNWSGMTLDGGSVGFGTVFQITIGTKSTKRLLHNFQGGSTDGSYPYGGLLTDTKGDLYGLTTDGGTSNLGVAFKLTPAGSESVLYSFLGGTDGADPYAGLVADKSGDLFGTTAYGGGSSSCPSTGCGTVFELTPSGSGYLESVLYVFQGGQNGPDGAFPTGDLTLDASGNVYGTTVFGGTSGAGTVFSLHPGDAAFSLRGYGDASYAENILYSFSGGSDGLNPESCVVMDNKGNLYGTTYNGGTAGLGTIFELTPSGSGYLESIVHNFQGGATDGANPAAGPLLLTSGALVVPTTKAGKNNGGMVGATTVNATKSNSFRCSHH